MTRSLALMAGLAGLAGTIGLITLVRPALTRRVLRIPASEPATYALRIAGMMLFALGLFLRQLPVRLFHDGGRGVTDEPNLTPTSKTRTVYLDLIRRIDAWFLVTNPFKILAVLALLLICLLVLIGTAWAMIIDPSESWVLFMFVYGPVAALIFQHFYLSRKS